MGLRPMRCEVRSSDDSRIRVNVSKGGALEWFLVKKKPPYTAWAWGTVPRVLRLETFCSLGIEKIQHGRIEESGVLQEREMARVGQDQ